MSSYRDPTLRGDGYPSEEEIDPTGVGPDPAGGLPAYPTAPVPAPTPEPEPDPPPGPGPAPRTTDGGRLDTVLREPAR
ncbi:hypothetical protein [Micromonospora sp. IBHARD004]|uniref:hypothetical protein n=1 Tax=Micromonospora sp. IBHARD004 TaxID=3457764 RepID=UPI004059378D